MVKANEFFSIYDFVQAGFIKYFVIIQVHLPNETKVLPMRIAYMGDRIRRTQVPFKLAQLIE